QWERLPPVGAVEVDPQGKRKGLGYLVAEPGEGRDESGQEEHVEPDLERDRPRGHGLESTDLPRARRGCRLAVDRASRRVPAALLELEADVGHVVDAAIPVPLKTAAQEGADRGRRRRRQR